VTEPLPLSLLNDHLYCPRRAALKVIEGWRKSNEHTLRGDIVHEHTDLRGYEVRQGVTLLRALPVFSERLGLNGKCDIVEAESHSPPNLGSEISNLKSLKPVEFKLGRRRQWDNDDAQLCAQALCLEEMFGIPVPRGAVFHADSKRRRDVEFTPELRALTEQAAGEVHALIGRSQLSESGSEVSPLPPAVFRPACEECSLYEVCLPRVSSQPGVVAAAARELFRT
jgi:CRISPR-associated exonuclease Cas4